MARTFGVDRACRADRGGAGLRARPGDPRAAARAHALDPFFATYYAVPIFIFYPIMVAIFGLSVIPILLMGVLNAIVAMVIATLNGLDRVPRVLMKTARVHHMGPIATALQLKLPAAAPHLFTGVKLAVSYGFIARDRERVHPGAGRARPRDLRRLFGFQQSAHVRADAAAADRGDAGQHGAARGRPALGGTTRDSQAMTATRRAADTVMILIVLLLAWQALHQVVGTTALPGPVPTLSYFAKFVPTSRFVDNATATLVCFAYALILSYAIGLAIGVWMGAHHLSGAVGEPVLVALYTLPKITLYPVVLLIFGLSLSGRVTFGAMHGVLPVALLTMNAIRNIPPVYLKSAKTLHLSAAQTILTVLLPATLPEVVAGLRIGFTLTLLGVLLAEMFASKQGLGFLIINAMSLVQTEEMITVAVVLFCFAALANALLLLMEHQLHRRV